MSGLDSLRATQQVCEGRSRNVMAESRKPLVVQACGIAPRSMGLQAEWRVSGEKGKSTPTPVSISVPLGLQVQPDGVCLLSVLATSQSCDYRCHHHGNSKSGLHLAEPSVPEALRASRLPMGRAAPGTAASPWDSLVEWNGGNRGGAGWVVDGKEGNK